MTIRPGLHRRPGPAARPGQPRGPGHGAIPGRARAGRAGLGTLRAAHGDETFAAVLDRAVAFSRWRAVEVSQAPCRKAAIRRVAHR